MKNIQSILVVVILLTAVPTLASEFTFVAGDKSLETEICIAAVNNNVLKYRHSVSKVSNFQPLPSHNHKIVANRLNCNRQSIAIFARKYGANDTAQYITRYLTRRVEVSRDVAKQLVPKGRTPDADKITIVVTAN